MTTSQVIPVFTSGLPINSCPFHSMTIGPPIPEIQFDLENSRSKVKVKGTPVSTASCRLISLVFHIRASYRFLSPSFHNNRASHSRDTIWPWKFKVKGQGQRYFSQLSAQLTRFLSVSHRASYRLPSLSFHDNWASHSWDTIWPWKLKVNGQSQRYPSWRSIQLTHFLIVSHQFNQPFLRYGK